jgi:hypothetical protein
MNGFWIFNVYFKMNFIWGTKYERLKTHLTVKALVFCGLSRLKHIKNALIVLRSIMSLFRRVLKQMIILWYCDLQGYDPV